MDKLDVLDNGGSSPSPVPNATAVLVLGIISIVGCLFYGIPGIVCGIIAIVLHKKDKALYLSNPERYDMSFRTSKAGNICAIVGLSMSIAFIIFLVIYFVFIFSFFAEAVRLQH